MTSTELGRRRQRAVLEILSQYHAATTDQLADLIYRSNYRLAARHLLRLTQEGKLHRLPHPLDRHGPFVYLLADRSSQGHSQKILHHLSELDFHLAVVQKLAASGVRVAPEIPWGPGSIPDQTVLLPGAVWAVEHHLSGTFDHAADYRRFMEEEGWRYCEWYRPGMSIGLLVVTGARFLDHVKGQLKLHQSGLTWRVGTRDNVLKDPKAYLI